MIWRNALDSRGLKVSRSKTEYLNAGDGEELNLQEEKIAKNFKSIRFVNGRLWVYFLSRVIPKD